MAAFQWTPLLRIIDLDQVPVRIADIDLPDPVWPVRNVVIITATHITVNDSR